MRRSFFRPTYETVKDLGDGGGGMNGGVLIVRHRATNELALEKKFTQEAVDLGYMSLELTTQRRAQTVCRNIVQFYDYGVGPSGGSVLMEFCEWGSLHDLIVNNQRREYLGAGFVYKVFYSIANALGYLHFGPAHAGRWTQMLHKDVKPQNVLLKGNRGSLQVKLCDFGCALLLPANREPPHISTISMGTPIFTAPEYLEVGYGWTTDIYGLGVTMLCVCQLNVMPAWPADRENVRGLVPPCYNAPSRGRDLARYIFRCTHVGWETRPSAKRLVAELEGKWAGTEQDEQRVRLVSLI